MKDIIEAIKPYGVPRMYKKQRLVLYQGEVPRTAYVLMTGIIKVYSLNNAGDEQIVMLHVPGEMFPVGWIFDKTVATQYYYETLADSELLAVPKPDLVRIVSGSTALLRQALDHYVASHMGMLMRITALEQARAHEKVMFTLYYLLCRYGKTRDDGRVSVQLHLTQTVIAGLVGLTRETTSSELARLRRGNILTYNSREYIINKPLLERALGEENFKDVSMC